MPFFNPILHIKEKRVFEKMIYAEKEKNESPFVSVNTITRGRVLSPTEYAYGINVTPPPCQAKEQTDQSRAPTVEIQEEGLSSQSSGQTLPDHLQPKMEEILGMDFTAVRLHHDTQSVMMAESIGAKAFTHGEDIYFNHGEYQPETTAGEKLLAHELTHVKQQKTIPGLQAKLQVPAERDRYEQEADTMAARIVSASPVEESPEPDRTFSIERSPLSQSIPGGVQLAKKEEKEGSNWFLNMLSDLLQNIPGYDLLTLVIGRDPVSGQEVKRDGAAYLQALVGLIPGGHLLMKNLEEAKVITKAVHWFKAEFTKLDLSFERIKGLFRQAWDSLSGWDLVKPSKAFEKVKHIFSAPIKRIKNFITAADPKLMELVFEGGLTLANAPVEKVMAIVNKGKDVLLQIISDPIGFLTNLLEAIQGGLQNFLDKIRTYLQSGLAGWLFGTLSNAGIVIPEKLDLRGIFSLIAQILEVTWQAIKVKVVKVIGSKAEQVMALVEKNVKIVTEFITKGPIALYEMVEELIKDLKTDFFASVIDWVRNTVIFKGVQKLISMFNPVGAIVQAAITIGSTIKFFIDKAKQIAAFANAVFDSVTEIAAGNLKKAVIAVEDSLAKALPVAIGFMAEMAGIGGIVAKIKDVIKKIREPIDKVVEKVVEFVADKAKAFIAKLSGAEQQREEPPQYAEEQDEQVMLEKDITTRLSTHKNAYLVKLGLYANTEHGSVEAKSEKTTEADRKIMLTLGKKHGCHHTGNKNLNYYVPDHQAPTSLFKLAETDTYVFNLLKTHGVSVHKKQRLYPQSKLESDKQGGVVSTLTQKLRKLIELKKNKNKG